MDLKCLSKVMAGILLFLLVSSAAGQSSSLPITGEAQPELAPFDKLMIEFVQTHKVPGAALAVTKRGKVIYARGFGYADKEQKTPVLPTALFRIASISKPITAVAILWLIDRGKLRLTDKVVDILNIRPRNRRGQLRDPRWRDVTIEHLLQHTGGWDRDKSYDPMFRSLVIARELQRTPPAQALDVIVYMADQPLDFQPGERYAYSNFGYCLLGRVIEEVSGQSYEDFVQQHILQPVGVTSMRLGKTARTMRAEREVNYYPHRPLTGGSLLPGDNNKQVPLPYGVWYLEAMDSHGGWLASAVDLVRFASDFDDPKKSKLLRPETVATMFARPKGLAGFDKDGQPKDVYYGCGWQVRPVGDTGRLNTWHTGALAGTSTLLVRRHDGLNWAVLFNSDSAENNQRLAGLIDSQVHQAANAVKTWPERDLFER